MEFFLKIAIKNDFKKWQIVVSEHKKTPPKFGEVQLYIVKDLSYNELT